MVEGWKTVQQLVDHDAEAPPVGRSVIAHAKEDFRWKVLFGAAEAAADFRFLEEANEAEIGEFCVAKIGRAHV